MLQIVLEPIIACIDSVILQLELLNGYINKSLMII